jgi:DNA-binding beta-propeller fold protein YncE
MVRWLQKLAWSLPFAVVTCAWGGGGSKPQAPIHLPSSKDLIAPLPGAPQRLSSFPSAIARSSDNRYLAVLNNGFGTPDSDFRQSIAIVDTAKNTLTDFPDVRLSQHAAQSFFIGLAFSSDGNKFFASLGSLTDPEGKHGGSGSGIVVYRFADGQIKPETFLRIPASELPPGKKSVAEENEERQEVSPKQAVPYPAGIATVASRSGDLLLIADNLSDDAILMDSSDGRIIHRFDLSQHEVVPAEYPYAAVATRDRKTGYISLWNSSQVAELDLERGGVRRFINLKKPWNQTAPGSHPTAMLLSPDEKWLYVALANRDAVAVIDTRSGRVARVLSTVLPGQIYGGAYPDALAQSEDGSRLFVANAGSDAVAVFDTSRAGRSKLHAVGFVPTGWYPTALAVENGGLFIASGKGGGTGANNFAPPANWPGRSHAYSYIPTLLHGSLARIRLNELDRQLASWTEDVLRSNRMRGAIGPIAFSDGGNPIRHVIYIIKENRSFDQILGDLGAGNGDASLTMYGEAITPNEHKLARQFGVLDNFYTSGEVSGDGHVWSTAAITSDYTERTWQIAYRSNERTYDYEGKVGSGYPLEEGIADVDEPGTGYLWGDLARHGKSYRHYGEFISTTWCNTLYGMQSPLQGTPLPPGTHCPRSGVRKGEALPDYLGDPRGGPSPWPWEVPLFAHNTPTKPELRGHFDPRFPDFNLLFPDQLRVDEFLNEFNAFGKERTKGKRDRLPQFVLLRLPNDHTAGTRPGYPTPAASVADNDLALGRVVEAVSHSPYWQDTAIFVLEDDAQDGPDHVDAHRSIAWVISKYAPAGPAGAPFVDHTFYTTVNMLRTMEGLLGLPAMNNNDARAALMAPMFLGAGNQPPFTADTSNRDNGLLYRTNTAQSPGARASAQMDFSHADAANAQTLNRILWQDRMKGHPYPPIVRNVMR